MNVKIVLYLVNTIIAIYTLECININNIFKKNRYIQSRVFYVLMAICISYMVTNFLYDFSTSFLNYI